MRISIITQYFPPDNGAASERMRAFADFFSTHFGLRVISTAPQHMLVEGDAQEDDFPFEVLRLRLKQKPGKGKYQRLIYEISFALRVTRLLLIEKENSILLFTTPSPFLAMAALLLKKLKQKEYILDIRDLYPEVIADAGIISRRNPIYMLAEILMRSAYHNANILTFVNWHWMDQLKKVNAKALFLPNGIRAKTNEVEQTQVREDLIVYSGNFGRMYDFDPILEIAERFQQHKNQILRDTQFLLIGDGIQADYIKAQILKRHLSNFKMVGPFNQNDVRIILKRGKIGIVSLNLNADSLKGAVPNKLFDYLEAGLKTIALIPETLSTEILSTEMISIHTSIDYEKLVEEMGDTILNFQPKEINHELFPFLYRDTHLENLRAEIEN